MLRHSARGFRAVQLLFLLILGAFAGCSGGTPMERAGIERLDVPAGWTPTSTESYRVPGVPLASWNGPDGGSFVVYRELSAPGDDPASLSRRVANRYLNFPGLKVISAGEVTFTRPASRVEAVAPGTGAAFLPTGTGEPVASDGRPPIPTRRVLISVPMGEETVSFLWHAPESKAGELAGQIEQFRPKLRSIRSDVQTY